MELPARSLDESDLTQVLHPPEHQPARRASTKRRSRQRILGPDPAQRPKLLDYWELTKPEISFLVAISALAGFLLGSPDELDGWLLGATLLGTALCSGGAGVLNHYLERHLDARMRRTANRPLPAGRIQPGSAFLFGAILILAGVAVLFFSVNTLTAALAALTILLYLGVYTPLKQRTRHNTLIGTVPGALPALGGWTAATGHPGAGGWAIFAILALWQMPHFLSLAWMYRKDYARAGYAMLPVLEPDGRSTARQTLGFTVLLAGASVLPTVVGVAGWVYLAGAGVLGLWFLMPAYAFFRSRATSDARRVLVGSILYIPLLVVLIFIDRLV